MKKNQAVNLKCVDHKDAQAVISALQNNDAGALKELAAKRFDFNIITKEARKVPLYEAFSQKCDEKIINILLKAGAQFNVNYEKKVVMEKSFLFEAIKNNYSNNLINLIVKNGGDVNYITRLNEDSNYLADSPLGEAIYQNNTKLVDLLLSNGADPNMRESKGGYPLFYCVVAFTTPKAKYDLCKIAKKLLDAGADVNSNSYGAGDGETVLISAVDDNNYNLTKLLLQNGADPNRQMSSGLTALHSSFYNATVAISKLLLKYGANPYVRGGCQNENFIDLAQDKNFCKGNIKKYFNIKNEKFYINQAKNKLRNLNKEL